ncbi:MAG: hypothetical protein DME33_09415 [Verrucomicrobia bacterium]|nr:MAG: hypothetical protein DME33_09415 [Verrucomicrobiota bacterium]
MQKPEQDRRHRDGNETGPSDLPPNFTVKNKRTATKRDHEILRQNYKGGENAAQDAVHFPVAAGKERSQAMHYSCQHTVEQYR